MERIFILGAGKMQIPVIKRAKEKGLYVIVADYDKEAPGLVYADKSLIISTLDKDGILTAAKEERINSILTTSDAPTQVVAYVGKQLGLCTMTEKTAKLCTNKYLQRRVLKSASVNCPFFMLYNEDDGVSTLTNYPYIVKPTDSSASRGVKKVNNVFELNEAIKEALLYSRNGEVIIEDYIIGQEFSVEALTQNNVTSIINITEKLTIGDNKYFVEDTHIEPARITKEEKEIIEKEVLKGINAVNLNNSPSHTEVKLNNEGVFIIEIACRLGGDYITSDLVPLSTGVNMLDNLINLSLGRTIDVFSQYNKVSCVQFLNPNNYYPCKQFIASSNKAIIRHEIEEYSDKPIRNSFDRLGYVILQTENIQQLEKILEVIK